MSRKTQKAYTALFSYLNQSIFQFKPEIFITDFEKGLRNGLRTVFPDANLVGCWFHYCQCLRRQIINNYKPLRSFLKNSEDGMRIYRKFQSLPLLPSFLIKKAVEYLKEDIDQFGFTPKFQPFLSYYDKQWMKMVTHMIIMDILLY